MTPHPQQLLYHATWEQITKLRDAQSQQEADALAEGIRNQPCACSRPAQQQQKFFLITEEELEYGLGEDPLASELDKIYDAVRSRIAPQPDALALIESIWKFCLINGAEEHGDLIGAPNDPFFTLKLLKYIAETRATLRQQAGAP